MGKGFSAEFRKMIVNLHLEEGRSVKWLAGEYGVSVSTIGRWVICHRNKETSKANQLSKGVPFDSWFIMENYTNKYCISQ